MNTAKWICASLSPMDAVPDFFKTWRCPASRKIEQAKLKITALGVYEASINGSRVGTFIMAPGWTAYEKRLQVQCYDVTNLLCGTGENRISVLVGKGWYSSPMPGWLESEDKKRRRERHNGLLAKLTIRYEGGETQVIATDETWQWRESRIRFSEIYDGEHYDASFEPSEDGCPVTCFEGPGKGILIPQEGEEVLEMERIRPRKIFRTPAGELVVDFGQEITGYPEFTVDARGGEEICIQCGEVLDNEGNFYNANYRSARSEIRYICRSGKQTWHPHLTFFGFRYLKLDPYPGEPTGDDITGIVVYSNIRRTGKIRSGHEKLDRLLSNIIWGQKGNFLDVPTDCPQRDERLGWTGDCMVFTKAATLNFDVERFYSKWLADLRAEQYPDGGVCHVVPNYLPDETPTCGWGDSGVICPWQVYQTYGNMQILTDSFDSMKRWVDYITNITTTPDLWTGSTHLGDWLGLDAPYGSYKGSSREDLIATAFYANAADLVTKTGRILGKDMSEYDALHERIKTAFRKTFPAYETQTEHVIALWFGLAGDPQKTAADLARMIHENGDALKTGFLGTPYLLHVLCDHGYEQLAWTLLLREKYPSWLFSVDKGATTVWEHWDGIDDTGRFWSVDMNSFNHYAYGAVIDWVYEKALGIRHSEDAAGFTSLIFEPHPDERAGWMEAELDTRSGHIRAAWRYTQGSVRIELDTPVPARVILKGKEKEVSAGSYIFWI